MSNTNVCAGGEEGRYSSASVGWGLMSQVIFAEINAKFQKGRSSNIIPYTRSDASQDILQTLKNVNSHWPSYEDSGLLYHWITCKSVKRNPTDATGLKKCKNWGDNISSVDTVIFLVGAFFAAEYMRQHCSIESDKDDCNLKNTNLILAYVQKLAEQVKWNSFLCDSSNPNLSQCNGSPNDGRIRMLPSSKNPDALTASFNEYYLVADLAAELEKNGSDAAAQSSDRVDFFNEYWSSNGKSNSRKLARYNNIELWSDIADSPRSSFVPQFAWYGSNAFKADTAYKKQVLNYFLADKSYWTTGYGKAGNEKIKGLDGRLFGSGPGQTTKTEYTVTAVGDDANNDYVVSIATQAGFRPMLSSDEKPNRQEEIDENLEAIFEDKSCVVDLGKSTDILPAWKNGIQPAPWRQFVKSEFTMKILNRCRIGDGSEMPTADRLNKVVMDYAVFVLGYASKFLPEGFYEKYGKFGSPSGGGGNLKSCPAECKAKSCIKGADTNGGTPIDSNGHCIDWCSKKFSDIRYCGTGADYKEDDSVDCRECSTG